MVGRLIRDFLWRERRLAAAALLGLMLGSVATVTARSSAATLMALSMSAAFLTGTLLTESLVTREVFQLPASPRQLWLARWWIAMLASVVLTTIPKLLVLRRGVDFHVLSLLCGVAYVGTSLALWPLFDLKPRGPARVRRATVRAAMILWLLTIGGGFAVWPLLLSDALPTEMAHLAGPGGLVLLAALALTAASYFHTPAPGAPRNLIRRRSVAGLPAAARAHAGKKAAAPIPHRITGAAYVLWRDARVAIIVALITVGCLVSLGLLTGRATSPSALIGLAADYVLPQSGSPAGRVGWLVLIVVCMPPGLLAQPGMARHLRSLPLSTGRVIALIVGVPLLRWLTLWLLLTLLLIVTGRPPRPWPVDHLLLPMGIAVVMHALGMRWHRQRMRPVLLLALLMAGVFVVSLFPRVIALVRGLADATGVSPAVLVGAGCFAVAVLLHHDTLTRRSGTYRRPPSVYGPHVFHDLPG